MKPVSTAFSAAPVQQVSNSPWSGLLLAAFIASSGIALHKFPFLNAVSPMILAVFLGVLFQNLASVPQVCVPGLSFSLKRLLKIAVVLLGLQLSLSQVLDVGWRGFIVIMLTLGSTFLFSLWVGKKLGLNQRLTRLIAAGTSICGASAIVATNSVVRGRDEDVAYSISIVTIFGFLSMLLFPVVGVVFGLTPETFGIWCGAAIHETAQVVGASFQGGQMSGEIGMVAKLSRVMFLVPVILLLGYSSPREKGGPASVPKRLPIPWFVLAFFALVVVNSLNVVTPEIRGHIKLANTFLLTMALAAMGLQMSFAKLKQIGLRPLCLGALSWLFVSVVGLVLATALA